MNILFLTTGRMESIEQHAIYPDLLRCFRDKGHEIYVVSPYEKRLGRDTSLMEEYGVHMLHVRIGNLTSTNLIEKGISTILIEHQFKMAIKKYFSGVSFDLVMYSTPPITLGRVIDYVKTRDNCKTYLLLKDIFPQNAVDLGMLRKTGIKGIIYKYFRNKEKKLYKLSDSIGCMSKANVEYVIRNNSYIDPSIVEVCPNCVEVIDASVDDEEKIQIRAKYDIPNDKTVFIYGGNLGRPQGIPFLIECLTHIEKMSDIFFLIVGDGTEYSRLEDYMVKNNPSNVKLLKRLPKEDYDAMVGACDIGLIFLDHRFTIPNFPSRLLSYMQAQIPVLAVTDKNSDVGDVITEGKFGWWCESNDVESFIHTIEKIDKKQIKNMRDSEFRFLNEHFDVGVGYDIIMAHYK